MKKLSILLVLMMSSSFFACNNEQKINNLLSEWEQKINEIPSPSVYRDHIRYTKGIVDHYDEKGLKKYLEAFDAAGTVAKKVRNISKKINWDKYPNEKNKLNNLVNRFNASSGDYKYRYPKLGDNNDCLFRR